MKFYDTYYQRYIEEAQELEREAFKMAKKLADLEARGNTREAYTCHISLHNLCDAMTHCYTMAEKEARGDA